MDTITKGSIAGLYVPLLTPLCYGAYDPESMERLVRSVEEHVDGFVPCLSTGEGQVLSDSRWAEVVRHVRSLTAKPVIAGIKRDTVAEVASLAALAEEIGCEAFITPVPSSDWKVAEAHLSGIVADTKLPFVIYNTENAAISDTAHLMKLDAEPRIVAMKDSSLNEAFFAEACALRRDGKLSMSVLQGMENLLAAPDGCDGYLVSLANAEPALVRSMLERPSPETNLAIARKFMEYNLGSEWYVSLKAILFQRGLLRSAEQAQQFVQLPATVLAALDTPVS